MKYTVKLENGQANYYIDDALVESNLKHFYEKKSNKTWYYVPENETNTRLVSSAALEANGGEVELKQRNPRTPGTSTKKSAKWQNYLTEEQKAILAEIEADCRTRMEADKPSEKETKKAKLLARIAKLEAELNDME